MKKFFSFIFLILMCLPVMAIEMPKFSQEELQKTLDQFKKVVDEAVSTTTTTMVTTTTLPSTAAPTPTPTPASTPAATPSTATLPTSGRAYSANMGIKLIREMGIFPRSGVTEGMECYGFKWYNASATLPHGWSKLIDQGTVSANLDGTVQEKPYSVYLVAEAGEPDYLAGEFALGPDGLLPEAKKKIDTLIAARNPANSSAPSVISGLGDYSAAVLYTSTSYANEETKYGAYQQSETRLVTLKGPFILSINTRIVVSSPLWSGFSLAPGLNLQDKCKIVTDPGAFNAKVAGWLAAQQNGGVELMRAFLAEFDNGWYDQPVARGNGFKGYYWADKKLYLPTLAQLPKGLVLSDPDHVKNPAKHMEQYSMELRFDVPDIESREKMDGDVEHQKKWYAEEAAALKKPVAVEIPGAEQASRMYYRDRGVNFDRIIFLKDNVFVDVSGQNDDKKAGPPPYTLEIAKLIAGKLVALGRK